MKPVLEIKNLKIKIKSDRGDFFAVDDVSLQIGDGEILGIVGESGCGKTLTSLSILKLHSDPVSIESGQILFKDEDLIPAIDKRMQQIRGRKISMIFQEPMTSLNPVFTCGEQVAEAIRCHYPEYEKSVVKKKVIDLLTRVGISDPERRYYEFPHQMSGGMRQRIMIAIALSCNPEIIIADEPTTALDVTIQAQILSILHSIQKERSLSILIITHDLGVIAEMCDRVIVMYAGKIVEVAPVKDLFFHSKHPYTRGLLASVPKLNDFKNKETLNTIPGMVPSVFELKEGCHFYDRCSKKIDRCRSEAPVLQGNQFHQYSCHNPINLEVLHP